MINLEIKAKETTNFTLRMSVEQRLQLELIAKKRRQNRNESYQHGIKEVYRRIQQSKKRGLRNSSQPLKIILYVSMYKQLNTVAYYYAHVRYLLP